MRPLSSATVTRTERPIKILQFGGGNFLRAFVDWMIEKSNEAGVTDHGIAVAHVTERPDPTIEILERQDGLFHVYLEGIKDGQPVKDVTLVTAVQKVVNAHTEYEEFREIFLSEDLELIVSNTTEAGITFLPGDDLAARPPQSFPAKLTALLHERWRTFDGDPARGLAVVCCELIEDNGSTLREYVLRHAADNGLESAFVDWVTASCPFYDTLVDRIVPGFPRDTIDAIKDELGYDDNLVVKGEYFYVWAIGGDPVIKELLPLDQAGLNVLFMDDIRPFRAKKVRILNGAHTAMSAVALQMGCSTVVDAFEDPLVESYVNRLVFGEVLPTIDEDQGALAAFAATILERFYNPFLQHRLGDIALNAVAKWQTRNLPVAVDAWTAGRRAPLTLFSFAALLVLYSGRSGVDFSPVDDPSLVDLLHDTFDPDDVRGWVSRVVAHLGLAEDAPEGFADYLIGEVSEDVSTILDDGMPEALKALDAVLR